MIGRLIEHLLSKPGALGVAFIMQERKRSTYQQMLRHFRDEVIETTPSGWIRFRNDARLVFYGDSDINERMRGMSPAAVYIERIDFDVERQLFASLVHNKGIVFDLFIDEPLSNRDYWFRRNRP